MQHTKFALIALVFLLTNLLTACGGGDTAPTADSQIPNVVAPPEAEIPPGSVAVYGTVADDYVVGALVFLDLNDNLVFDFNEPVTESGRDGGFYLVATPEEFAAHRVVANITADNLVQGTVVHTINRDMTLIAPPGEYSQVNPITTAVAMLMDIDGITADEARNALMSVWQDVRGGVAPMVDLKADYIANSASGENLPIVGDYQKMKRIAETFSYAYSRFGAGITVPSVMGSAEMHDFLRRNTENILVAFDIMAYRVETNTEFYVARNTAETLFLISSTGSGPDLNYGIDLGTMAAMEYSASCLGCHANPASLAPVSEESLITVAQNTPEMSAVGTIFTTSLDSNFYNIVITRGLVDFINNY